MPADALETTSQDASDDFVGSVTSQQGDQNSRSSAEGGEGRQQQTDEKPDELKTALAELAGHVKTLSQPKTERREPTPDEVNEFWGVYEPEKQDKEFFSKFFRLPADMDPQEKAQVITQLRETFGAMQKGLMRQAVTAAQRLIEKWERDKFEPVSQFVTQEKARGVQRRFNEAYPDLSDKKYSKILQLAAKELADQSFADEDAYFKAVAETAAGHISGIDPNFKLGASGQNKSAAKTPRLPRTSVGGTGGTGGGGDNEFLSSGKDLASKIF